MPFPISIEELAHHLSAENKGLVNGSNLIKHLIIDSRKIFNPSKSIFFALPGQRLDGHHFIDEVYEKGVRNFIVSELPEQKYPDANFLKVSNCLEALQKTAAFNRQKYNGKLIAITGSNGKTTVKEWTNQLMEDRFSITRSPKSFNSQIGVPLSLWQLTGDTEIGIIEAGISTTGEMEKLEAIIKPDIVLFTNLGDAHDDGFSSRQEKLKEKLILARDAKTVICHTCYKDLIRELNPDVEIIDWSYNSEGSFYRFKITKSVKFSLVDADEREGTNYSFQIPFVNDAHVENNLHAIVLSRYLGLSSHEASQKVMGIKAIDLRLEVKEGNHGSILINDSYSNDLNSLRIALDFLDQQAGDKEKVAILSGIVQASNDMEEVSGLLKSKNVSKLYGVGDEIIKYKDVLEGTEGLEVRFFGTTKVLMNELDQEDFKGKAVLIKGARKYGFERIVKRLERRSHGTKLEIDLNAIKSNLNVYHNLLSPRTKMMVVVKAFSYGSGSYELAKLLQYQQVDYLAVAYTDEGVELRKQGIELPIMVMNPETWSFDALVNYDLEPEIYSIEVLDQFIQYLPERMKNYPVHLKLNTGMNRLGINEVERVKDRVLNEKLKVVSAFSHLVASEDESKDDFSKSQIQRFQNMASQLEEDLGYPILKHICNSSGMVRFPEAHFDMVRLGLGLYGYDTSNKIQEKLLPGSSLRSSVSQIQDLKRGDNIGYGNNTILDKDSVVATVAIGYADGYNRKLGNGNAYMIINGKKAYTIGSICMDMCMLDVSEIKDLNVGDEVVVFGKDPSVLQLAEILETIPYEILTSVSERVKRVYFED